ncbi:MAG: hypothetical protein DI537_10315 [Stutzerimonas stutzeri]|nr:MAG: hypothetical protein DI537_10315 [Stutzerimonas stutzeri]
MTMLRVFSHKTRATKYYLNGRRCTRDRWYDHLAASISVGRYNSSYTLTARGADYHYCHG